MSSCGAARACGKDVENAKDRIRQHCNGNTHRAAKEAAAKSKSSHGWQTFLDMWAVNFQE